MLKIGTDWMLSRIADIAFMLMATILAILTGYVVLAALFGAKAVLGVLNLFIIYRRNQRLRFQLVEHLYRDDID
jgi:hypothetical protein